MDDSYPQRKRYIGRRDDPLPNKCIGVFGLAPTTTEDELKGNFAEFSSLRDVVIVRDNQTNRSRGFGFCYFDDLEEAKSARTKFNGTELDGRTIRVDYSITRRAHTPTPGVYMGRTPSFSRRSRGHYSRTPRYPSYRRSHMEDRGRYPRGEPYYNNRSFSPEEGYHRRGPSRSYRRSPSYGFDYYDRY